MNINRVLVAGNLTRDPELRALPNGGSVCSFSIATNHSYKKADGTKVEDAQFHNLVCFGKQAESCAQYLKKGGSAFVEGRIQTRSYEKDGQKVYRTEIIAERVQFGPRKENAPHEQEEEPVADYSGADINPDDIPF